MTAAEQAVLVNTLVEEIVRVATRYNDTAGLRRAIALEQINTLSEKLQYASEELPAPRAIRPAGAT